MLRPTVCRRSSCSSFLSYSSFCCYWQLSWREEITQGPTDRSMASIPHQGMISSCASKIFRKLESCFAWRPCSMIVMGNVATQTGLRSCCRFFSLGDSLSCSPASPALIKNGNLTLAILVFLDRTCFFFLRKSGMQHPCETNIYIKNLYLFTFFDALC